MRQNPIFEAIDEQASSNFPDWERTISGEPEKKLLKKNKRRTETILIEMIDKSKKHKKPAQRKRRQRRRSLRIVSVILP